MSDSFAVFLFWLVSIPFFVHSDETTSPKGFTLSCGDSEERMIGSLKFVPDRDYTSVGNATTLKTPGLLSLLSTLRFFPDKSARKYCYTFNVTQGEKYLVKTMYYYGGYDGGKKPPVFDQIIDGTKWSIVNTTEDYANGLSSYYEIFVAAAGKKLSLCLARNENTVSHPFISAIELQLLEDSVYNATDFSKYALSTVERSSFGDNTEDMIVFPDDKFDRLWHPFKDENPTVNSRYNVTPEDFWNMPPVKAFTSSITSRGKSLEILWPPVPLPSSRYYLALYFQDDRSPSPYSWRVFDVFVNGNTFYKDLNVTTKGVTVYGSEWSLSGQTNISLTPANDESVGPIISAGEILQVVPIGGITLSADVTAMEELAKKFKNPPSDWSGDPCLPSKNSWTGVTCSDDNPTRVVNLNLTSLGLSGSLSESIANLTALKNLWLGGNKLSGSIPEMKSLTKLQTLHLENNQFEGRIPQWLSQLGQIREIFLQNNNIDGQIPDSLKKKTGLNIQVSPGNRLKKSQ